MLQAQNKLNIASNSQGFKQNKKVLPNSNGIKSTTLTDEKRINERSNENRQKGKSSEMKSYPHLTQEFRGGTRCVGPG